MALPVAPPPKSKDVAARGRAGITVRVAWTLLRLGVKVRPEVLDDARTHALFHIDPATPGPHAEDLAAHHTAAFVARARGEIYDDPWAQDWEMPLSPRWRRALDRSMTALARAVFRKHYGDNRSLARLQAQLGVERIALEAARGGLREVVRRVATADGLPIDDWSPERVDRILERLAAWSPGPCPPVLDIVEGCHREHVDTCARCDRMARLVRASILTVDDLLAPTIGARPTGRARALAVQLHPDARRHRRAIVEELPVPSWPLGDVLLLDADDLDRVGPVLHMACEVGRPGAELVRGAVVEGPGRWTPRGLLGPMAEQALREVRHRSWGRVDDLGELPPPLPPPPTARRWWTGVALCAVMGVFVLFGVLRPPATATPAPPELEVTFVEGRGGLWTAFDAPEDALVLLVRQQGTALEPVLWSRSSADKAVLATGDGSYRVHVPGVGALLAVVDAPVPGAHALLERVSGEAEPLEALARELQHAAPDARVRWRRR